MRILDSRRLTGPSLLLDGPGAVLEVELAGLDPARAIATWRAELRLLLEAVGWSGATLAARAHRGGLTLAFSAPMDALYAATEVNEAAWHASARRLGGGETPRVHGDDPHDPGFEDAADDGDEPEDPGTAAERLAALIASERRPELLRLEAEGLNRGVTVLADDRRVSIGLGAGSRAWPVEDTAAALERLDWSEVHDVPVALVTGTNGKTTTVRLLGAMARAAGRVAGVTSTDHVTVGEEMVAAGDYSGPNGARTVLRDRRVEIAILELARGGILRRGLALPNARVAAVTNVANDHLGEFGIFDVESLADAKLVVAKAVSANGRVVLNADDPLLLARGQALRAPVLWFTLDAANPAVLAHVDAGGDAAWPEDGALVLFHGGRRRAIVRVDEVPIAFGGAARHNVANALAAIGVAATLGFGDDAIRAGLAGFDSSPAANPGRANVWSLGGLRVIVDFAHNPHGLDALARMTAELPARRRGAVIGQAGDRDDDSIREFARRAWAMGPERVFIKEMEIYLRGREPGVVPAMIEAELRRLGAPREALVRCATELEAVRAALIWAREGDLLLLTTHAERDEVIALIGALHARGWKPGDSLEDEAAPTVV